MKIYVYILENHAKISTSFLKKKKKSKLMIEKHTDLSTLVKFYRLYIGKNN